MITAMEDTAMEKHRKDILILTILRQATILTLSVRIYLPHLPVLFI
jgi:hypothetical protein